MQKSLTAIYCRVDSGGNPEMRRQALEMQRRMLEHYAITRGLQLTGYYEDDGRSGHDLDRPGLMQLMHDYAAGAFAQVLVFNQSRLYRGVSWKEPQWPFRICSISQLDNAWYD